MFQKIPSKENSGNSELKNTVNSLTHVAGNNVSFQKHSG